MISSDLQEAAMALERALNTSAATHTEAREMLIELASLLSEARQSGCITPLRRLRYDHLFTDGPLSHDVWLADAYSRFANLVEGIHV